MKKLLFVSLLMTSFGALAQAEAETAPAPAPAEATKAAEPAPAPKWYEKVKLEGMVDAYYGYRFQGSPSDRVNEFRTFDTRNHAFSLGYSELALSLPAEPAGFRLDLGFGEAADLASSDYNVNGYEIFKHIQQAYATVKLGGLVSVDVGKFVTSAGAEVIESKDNWLYSRTMMFAYGPYTHTGLRISAPVGDMLTLQGGVLNGWDSVFSALSWKTFNLSAILNVASSGTTVYLNFYGGPYQSADIRLFFDLVVNQSIGEKAALNLNAEYGAVGPMTWYAAALMGKYMLTDSIRLAARVEYFGDPSGAKTGTSGGSFVMATLGAGFAFSGLANVELRPEVRHDQALGGLTPYVNGTSASQTTVQLAAVAWF